MPGKLYLIPTTIDEEEVFQTIPSSVKQIAGHLRFFFVEEEKSARRFLKKFNPHIPIDEYKFFPLNEHSQPKDTEQYLQKAVGQDIGIISESGCPCVADPGADVVLWAHRNNMEVIPLVGPSSVLLALMASGLNGQNFAFNGYLPKEKDKRIKKIKELERRSQNENQTQIFMETPYRNQNVLDDILAFCVPETYLCLAVDLTGPEEYIKTLPVKEWKKHNVFLNKTPALFLIGKRS